MLIVLSVIGVLLFILIAFMFFLIMLILVKIDNNILDNERKEFTRIYGNIKNIIETDKGEENVNIS
jgi:hypothetical protein